MHGKECYCGLGCYCQGTHFDVTHLKSNQEEVDTKIILHAPSRGANEITIHSPDTDVFVLSSRRYPRSKKIAALPGLHGLSGADTTRSFAGKGKAT